MEITIQKAKEFIQIIGDNGSVITLYAWQVILIASICVAFWLAVYVLMGIGLYVMGKNRNIPRPYLSFVPFARYYYMGKVAGQTQIFGKKIKNLGLVIAITAAVTTVLNFLYNLRVYFPLIYTLSQGNSVVFILNDVGELVTNSYGYEWNNAILVLSEIAYYISYFGDILLVFLKIMVYIELFKKYSPEHYFLYSILCIFFPIDGIFVFCLRKKVAVNFNDYLKERFMRMQGTFMGHRPTPPDNPFREFGERGDNDPGDPFADFANEKNEHKDDIFEERKYQKPSDENEPFSEFNDDNDKK